MGYRRREFEAWLERWLAAAEPGMRLDPQRRLAEHWGMSPTTINRLLRPHVESGRLRATAGAGMEVPGAGPVTTGGPWSEAGAPAAVVDRLLKAIAASVWRHGDSLPPQRELAQMFGAGRDRVARGLQELEVRGLIHRRGRRLVVGAPSLQAKRQMLPARLLLFGHEDQLATGVFSQTIPHIEDECYRQRVSVHQYELDGLWQVLGDAGALQRTRGVLACCPDDFDFDRLFALWSRPQVSSGRGSLRLVVAGPRLPTRQVPAGCDVLPRGSFHTRVCRRAAEVAAAMRPARVQVIHDGRRPGQLKTLLRILPELDHRLPGRPWELLVVDPSGGPLPADYVAQVTEGDGKGLDYYRGLLGQYRAMRLEELADRQRVVDASELTGIPPGSLTIVENVAVAEWLDGRGLLDHDRLGRDAGLLVLDDLPTCRARGWASCSVDARGTAHAIVHALLGDLPVERTSRGYLRPHARFLPRNTVPVSAW